MATKNLARTLIEGGRGWYGKYARGVSHSEERALTREFLSRGMREADGFDARAVGKRQQVPKTFEDRLAAPRRWLRSHVGRPWDKVRSEMFERFDPRTLAGRHIIFCHLLKEVRRWDDPKPLYRSDRFLIDRYGILRVIDRAPREKRCHWSCSESKQLADWARGRRVGGDAFALYWYVLARECSGCARKQCCCPVIDGKTRHGAHQHYRQDARLSDRDVEQWQRMCSHVRDRYRYPTALVPRS